MGARLAFSLSPLFVDALLLPPSLEGWNGLVGVSVFVLVFSFGCLVYSDLFLLWFLVSLLTPVGCLVVFVLDASKPS